MDNTDGVRKRDVINYFLERRDSADYAKYGLKVLMAGVEIGWTKSALTSFLKYAMIEKTEKGELNIWKKCSA